MSGSWTAKLEYDYIDLARRNYNLADAGLPNVGVDPNIHLVKLGLNYRFGDLPDATLPINARTTLPRIQQLEYPRADDLSAASLSGDPFAL